ncbi:MAG: protease inhibitor I42 family protein [Methanolinea sp.]
MHRSTLFLAPVAILSVCLILAAGCLQEQGSGGVPTPTPTSTIIPGPALGPGDNGKNVTIAKGTEFSLTLPENPTTGYSWYLSQSPGTTLLRDEYISPASQVMGAGGSHAWFFMGEKSGDQSVYGEYRRPWVPSGTVTYQDFEGGFYGIAGDDGKNYLPLNLESQYRVDGMRISFECEEAKDVATIQMWGIPVHITFIEPMETFHVAVKIP